jgi:DNA-binding MarR family transcriptional regulator
VIESREATSTQRRVLRYLSQCAALGNPPSLSTVGRRFNLSKSRVRHILEALHARGLLRRATTDGTFCDHELELEPGPDTNRVLAR